MNTTEEQEGRTSQTKRTLSPEPGKASKFVRGEAADDKEVERGEKGLEDLGSRELVERIDGLSAAEVVVFLSNKCVLYLLDIGRRDVDAAVLEALIRAAGVHEDWVDQVLRDRFRKHLYSSVGRDRVRYGAFTNTNITISITPLTPSSLQSTQLLKTITTIVATTTTSTPTTPKATTKTNTTITNIAKSSSHHQHHQHYHNQEH